jgi:hypothetical protein
MSPASGALNPTSLFTRILMNLSPPICLGAIAAVLMHRPTTFRWIERWIGWRLGARVIGDCGLTKTKARHRKPCPEFQAA